MDYTRLGSSGLKVSRSRSGCMSFGTGEHAHGWALDDAAAAPVFRQAVELGITFWDTANIYSLGTSEEVVGRAIKEYSRREDVVLATKVNFRMHDGPGGSGLSRKAIMEQVDASLRRLGTDYVDLYQIHRFDPATPVEETMEALHDVVKAGQGALPRGVVDVGLAVRDDAARRRPGRVDALRLDAEPVQPAPARGGAGDVRPARRTRASAASRGARWRRAGWPGPGASRRPRAETDELQKRYDDEANPPIVAAVQQVAEARGVPMAQVALAWVLRNPVVTAPIVGPTKEHHLTDAVAAVDLELTDDEVETARGVVHAAAAVRLRLRCAESWRWSRRSSP